jgi:hypothetical protein
MDSNYYYKEFFSVDKSSPKNDLEKYFFEGDSVSKKGIHKWFHYFEIYDRYFSKYRNKKVRILEIGVQRGGSLQMWKEYFGEDSEIVGIDIDPNCKQLEEEGIKIFIGDQGDRNFWKKFKEDNGKFDIVIDDGGHFFPQQITTFEEIFSWIEQDGVYLCEDLLTSYLEEYGGGYKKEDTFIEYSKNLIDYLNSWHNSENNPPINDITKNTFGIHFYDSVVVMEKRKINPPFHTVNTL